MTQEDLDKLKKSKQKEDQQKKKEIPRQPIENKPNIEGILPDEKKKPSVKDSTQ